MVSATPAFSIIMAAHDSARTIGAAIESVRLQTCADWELVVVDDGSTDDTVAIVSGIGDERIRLHTQANGGPSSARNAGLRASRAPIVCTLDSDDLWLPHYLETVGSVLVKDEAVDVVYTDAWVLDDSTGRVRRRTEMHYQRPPLAGSDDPRAFLFELLQRNFVYNSVALRRRVLDRVHGYDERLWTGEDWELWLRIAAAGFRFHRVAAPLAVHRDHPGTLSTDAERMRLGDLQVYEIVEREWGAGGEVGEWARGLSAARARRGTTRFDRFGRPVLRRVKHTLVGRRQWLEEAPSEVAELLAHVSPGQRRSD
jgi:glycosyltransferase involved in cell wall biosynthesis